MSHNIKKIIEAIVNLNNRYRDSKESTRAKLEIMWEIGDVLTKMGVKKPHKIGWEIQEETRGLIKRPTIFRSYKIRSIWNKKEELINNLGEIKSLSNLTEILPLIDPAQKVRSKLSKNELECIYKHTCSNSQVEFNIYLKALKKKYSCGRLGQSLDKFKHLKELNPEITKLKKLISYLTNIISAEEISCRKEFRDSTTEEELNTFSNMCISLTTKNNLRLYKHKGATTSDSKNNELKDLYDYF